MLGCFERTFGFSNPLSCGSQSGIRTVQRLFALIKQFLGRPTVSQQGLGTLQLLSGQRLLRALLFQICLGFIDRTLRLLDLRLRLLERLLQIPGIHASDHLSRGDHIADVGVAARRPCPEISCRYRFRRPPAGHCPNLCRRAAATESASTNRNRLPLPRKEWQKARSRTVTAARSRRAQRARSPVNYLPTAGRGFWFLSAAHHRLPACSPAVSRQHLPLAAASSSPTIRSIFMMALLDRAGIERYQTVQKLQTLNGANWSRYPPCWNRHRVRSARPRKIHGKFDNGTFQR